MNERKAELHAILSDVRRRWTQRSMLRAWTLGAAAAATVVLAGFGAMWLVARDGVPLVATAIVVLLVTLFALTRALWSFRYKPTDAQLARYIEERSPGLDDVVVTAVDYAGRANAEPRMRELLDADAAHALSGVDRDVIVSRRSIRHAALRAATATAVLALAAFAFAPGFSRATNVASAYLFPARLNVEVTPGTAKVRAGQPITITARLRGLTGELIPTLTVAIGEESRQVRMSPAATPGTFAVTIENVSTSFAYNVSAATTRSDDYTVTVIRPPRVERIDVRYEFPQGLGLEPRTEEDSGDIYGPAGTKVRLTVTADKPITNAFLVLSDGSKIALNGQPQVLDGALTIEDDDSYRIALADQDGLENTGDTEYFIRTLDDRPPDVRILRPASDKKVTPLEEVQIEARADDDYGIASFELVFQAANGKERAVPLRGSRGGLTASGLHTLFMEDLGVQPGDFVTYYARARDVNRGRRSTEARSDIFFLEVKPFEEEFVAAQSQAMGQGGGMQGSGLEGLAEAQKEIIVATWKLDARARRARDTGSQQDIKAISKAQADLKTRAEQATAQQSRMARAPRRGRGTQPTRDDDPIALAVQAMGRAVGELDQFRTNGALPHEMEALNQLLKAEAEVRRRQISRQQQAGGGGGMNRSEADLSNLFDQELRKRQETNYETPNSSETREDTKQQDDPLERIRELARRQNALNRERQDVERNRDKMAEEELKRQLERLTREQNQLRQEAEQLAQQMQRQGSQGSQSSQSQGQQGQQGQQASRQLREISEDMRNAATGTRRQDSQQANASGSRAAERLRELEQQMQGSGPDNRRRALGDLQLEARQLADQQRRVANEASRTAQGQAGDDARRRLAGEQERLADRTQRLQDNVKRLARNGEGEPEQRKSTDEAARELERQKIAERMRESAETMRQSGQDAAKQGEDLARGLDKVAERLGAAAGAQQADARRLSDQLSKTQELRDKIGDLERSIEQLQREAQQGQQGQQGQEGRQQGQQANGQQNQGEQGQRPGSQQANGQQGQQPGQGQSPGSQASAQGREGSSGQSGGTTGGNGGRLEQLQRELGQQMRDAERLAGEIRRENPSMEGQNSESWWRSFSAPGTEAFKQDFAKWESLKKNLLLALEDVESKLSNQLRARENSERLNAGGHDAVSEAYRGLVDKYYRSLASPRRPQ